MRKFSDIHFHPMEEFFHNSDEVILEAIHNNVNTMFVVGTSLKNANEVKKIASKYPNILFPIIGIHPSESFNPEEVSEIEKLLDKNIIAIGEVGLDYHYKENPSKDIQIKTFKNFLRLSIKNKIPTMIHLRDAFDDMYKILSEKEFMNQKVVFHTFSGDKKWAKRFLDLHENTYFSFSGVSTFKNANDTRETINIIPLNRIFVETDAPYLTPHPYRGKKNKPVYVKETAKYIANLKKVSIEEFNKQINENIEKFFILSKYVS